MSEHFSCVSLSEKRPSIIIYDMIHTATILGPHLNTQLLTTTSALTACGPGEGPEYIRCGGLGVWGVHLGAYVKDTILLGKDFLVWPF